jgi:delta 1-pyrroline-5-carboxylate dehydrogenase
MPMEKQDPFCALLVKEAFKTWDAVSEVRDAVSAFRSAG